MVDSRWFRRFGTAREGELRLLCFPHAGASATAFLRLARTLPAELDVLSVQYPGRQDRRLEEPATSLVALAEAIAEEWAPTTDEPYAFFGHSMGAVVAYETARLLAARGLPLPRRLFLSGRGAPGPRPSVHDQLSTDAEVLAAVRRLGGTSQAVLQDPELLELVMPVLRADYRALGSYAWRGGTPLEVPVTALVGNDDPVVTMQEAMEWGEHTRGDFALEVFPGGHFYLEEQLSCLASVLSAGLLVDVTAS
ncbi:thioesterase II family protein [Streptomyces lancefieldiae]|uniref:Alpha/beta fold hydrolase n=1 Tax=Streptomyces lancefieldiae TaxID=3075520 RepID=A0ABU3AYY1_9ACTN|nr:alpha/beta fold hydrolase [Streptomyces sp. DSM 40712]MDT0615402.1 alpha/beta fold hydrolase [Streptomyces sp. DSM 40712]